MASIAKDPNGTRRILFTAPDRKRKTIRLGKTTQRAAEAIKTRVEQILAATLAGQPLEADTARWIGELPPPLHEKLAAVGLIAAKEATPVRRLAEYIKSYVESRTDVKPATKEIWRQGETGLLNHFGPDKSLTDVTAGDADGYKLHLIGTKLASMTVRKRLYFANLIFRAAMRKRLISENPFAGVSVKTSMPNRERLITPAETAKLLDACSNIHWRAIVALSRFGGLRCPSEVLSLRWEDVNWETGRVVVTSPKTEHHPGKEMRIIPLFPELRVVLEEAFELAPERAVYVVDERMRAAANGPSGWRNCNLRTTFEKIVRRAGLTPWPRLFHNLRSSRQTELAELFPSHVVCDWLGNSEAIARKHYYQTTDDHFTRAMGGGAESGTPGLQHAAQKPAQQTSVQNCTDQQAADGSYYLVGGSADHCESLRLAAVNSSGGQGIRTLNRLLGI